MKISQSILRLALAGATSAATADAESTPPNIPTFVNKVAQANLTEIEVGKIALTKSKDPAIREFAERMVADHTKANEELATLATSKGIASPNKLDAEQQTMISSMLGVDDADFDNQYARHMNSDHAKVIALCESATLSGDPDVADFAHRLLPTLKEHKLLAERLPGQTPGQPGAISHGQPIWKEGADESEEGDGGTEGRNAAQRQLGQEGHEPQAGDRDRAE